jgi:hypothetical protein
VHLPDFNRSTSLGKTRLVRHLSCVQITLSQGSVLAAISGTFFFVERSALCIVLSHPLQPHGKCLSRLDISQTLPRVIISNVGDYAVKGSALLGKARSHIEVPSNPQSPSCWQNKNTKRARSRPPPFSPPLGMPIAPVSFAGKTASPQFRHGQLMVRLCFLFSAGVLSRRRVFGSK